MAAPMLDIDIGGYRPNVLDPGYNPWDQAWYDSVTYGGDTGGEATPDQQGGGQGDVADDAFVAPPLPPVLAPPAPPPSILAPIAEVVVNAARTVVAPLAPLIALFAPSPIAAEPDVNQLTPLWAPIVDDLPEVRVTAPPVKPPNKRAPFAEAPLPPNWADMLDWRRPLELYQYMFPYQLELPGDGKQADSERRRDAAPSTPRSDPVADPIADVVVTGKRSAPVQFASPVAPVLYSFPIADPIGVAIGDPFAEPLAQPRTAPAPRQRAVPRLDLRDFTLNAPLSDLFNPFADPIGDAIASPFTPVRPGDDVRVPNRQPEPIYAAPGMPFPDLFAPGAPSTDLDPLTDPAPDRADPCNCQKVKTKEKSKKPKKPRTVCYRGSYTEKANSLQKSPKEQVPCQ